ncbi:MAG: metal ABC transporter permease [Candidatus Omnitrophica bacterium]|nr:metal ABC transporter permease [Candidatus Omnitrophota bacterium]
MDMLKEALQFAFIQRALWAGCLVAVSCAFLGVFLVLRRFAMIGDGLAHISFAAIALGLLIKVTPIFVAVPLVVLAALGILRLSDRSWVYGDAAIGLLSAIGVATGVLIASFAGGFNVDLFSYLFGNILSVSRAEVALSVVLSFIIIGVVNLFYHDLFAATFDQDHAQVSGIRTGLVNRILLVLTALTVVLGIKVVGTMLVSSLIIFPAVSALFVARSFRTAILLAAVFGLFSVVAGIFVSYAFNLPSGATIVYVNFVIFIILFILKGRTCQ